MTAGARRRQSKYRRLAATLHHLQLEQGLNRLMVASAVPQEGKTLTIVNLAMTLSESYRRRVLLIDADLRRPSIHDVFGIPNQYGLCDALRSEQRELRFSRVSPLLWVLPGGPPDANPMRALASDRMERFLDEVGSAFDWILLDAPPVALMADAGVLARLTRAVILVIGAGSTPYGLVEKVVAELGREHIVGAVLNGVEERATQWSTYYAPTTGRDPSSRPDGELRPAERNTKGPSVVSLKSAETATFGTNFRHLRHDRLHNMLINKHLSDMSPARTHPCSIGPLSPFICFLRRAEM